MEEKGLKVLISVSLVMAFGGLFYLFLFGFNSTISPFNGESGIVLSFSPQEDLQVKCDNGVFQECLATSSDPVCNAMKKGIVADNSLAIKGSTLCEFVKCVC